MNLSKIDLTQLEKHTSGVPDHFANKPGTEAYALYAHFSLEASPGTLIVDLGTLQGLSALALSINPKVGVISYDIDLSKNLVKEKENIEFVEGNCFDHIEDILKADIILVDIDPHDGWQERDFYDILVENKYKGVTLWDDIHLNLGMSNFWSSVELDKIDLTEHGHHSGTGRIDFK